LTRSYTAIGAAKSVPIRWRPCSCEPLSRAAPIPEFHPAPVWRVPASRRFRLR
jgi:hypothetical protein